ncbi:hypothetical protein [Pseudohoeflea coraliihabitans]|uniref:Lipoprotein n=1 Tax=Pseudohoeflea coraliihabitans TaxID=2860393 RepID=A0ABS6WRH3_9HYPH|nr:hypothetical protein [Pseudohoeflea sp. DP4N28-3]MBW3098530.1 hypothetical protein [Pseudohoeflea sp. DP4N28-3]
MTPRFCQIATAVRGVLIVILALTLAACAARPKPPATYPAFPVAVRSVQVTAGDPAREPFARDLAQKARRTLGRTNAETGTDADLHLFIREWMAQAGGTAIRIDLYLIEPGTGRVLHAAPMHHRQPDEAGLVASLIADLRHRLGLAGTPPVALDAAKRSVARPVKRPVVAGSGRTTDAEAVAVFAGSAQAADPLLDGTVTPTTTVVPVVTTSQLPARTIDTSKPLLAPPTPQSTPQPAGATSGSDMTGGDDGDIEPCIVTLENDCAALTD